MFDFLHGLRVSELVDLRWDDIDWRRGTIAIRRLKGSIDGTHYLERDVGSSRRTRRRMSEPGGSYASDNGLEGGRTARPLRARSRLTHCNKVAKTHLFVRYNH